MPDYEAALTGDIRGMRIGVPTNYFLDGVDPEVMAAFETAVDVLRQRGAIIVPVTVPLMDAVATYGSILSRVEGAAIHAQWMRERPQDYAIHLNARLYRRLRHSGDDLRRGAGAARRDPEGGRGRGVRQGRGVHRADDPHQVRRH